MQGSPEEKEQASFVLLEVLEAARVVAVMLTPVAPALARLVYLQLGFSDQGFETLTWADAQWGGKLLCKHLGQSSFGSLHNHGRSTSQNMCGALHFACQMAVLACCCMLYVAQRVAGSGIERTPARFMMLLQACARGSRQQAPSQCLHVLRVTMSQHSQMQLWLGLLL